jgi:hypothetical protein
MLEAWSSKILQACHEARVVALADALELATVCHSLLHGLEHLSLHYQNFLKCWGWRRIVGSTVDIVLIGIVVAVTSVSLLVILKRFEIEIEIKDSQLYASRYNDD